VRVVCLDRGPVWRLIRQLRLDGHWSLHHEVPDAVDGLGLPRVVPTSSPGAPDGWPQGRPESDPIGPLDTARPGRRATAPGGNGYGSSADHQRQRPSSAQGVSSSGRSTISNSGKRLSARTCVRSNGDRPG
jgi:hypothetical protein